MPVYKWMRVSTLLHYHPKGEAVLRGYGIDTESVMTVYLEDLCDENDLEFAELQSKLEGKAEGLQKEAQAPGMTDSWIPEGEPDPPW